MIKTAQLLESNCPNAVINYTKNNLAVTFDSTDPQDPNISGLTYSWDFGDGQTVTTAAKNILHNYAAAGTYNASLTVTDSFGTSDTASVSVVVQSTVGNLVICNGGLVQITMSFSIDSIPGFNLDNIKHFDSQGRYISSTCECKSVNIPAGQSVGINVVGSNPSDGINPINIDLIPYNGFISAQPGIQYFTVVFGVIGNNDYYRIYKGVAYSTSCQEYVYK
jgi:PKD repeat protein